MNNSTTKFDVADYYKSVVKKNIETSSAKFIKKCFDAHPLDDKSLSASSQEIYRLEKNIHDKSTKGWKSPGVTFAVVLLFILGLIGGIILLVFMLKNRKRIDGEIAQLTEQKNQLITKNMGLLKPVCDQITTRASFDLMENSYPSLKLNEIITNGDYDNFAPYLDVSHKNITTYSNLHGFVQTHPFFLLTQKRVDMVPKVYTGSTTITVMGYDSNGHSRPETRVVTAQITKPFPEFTFPTRLLFRAESLHDLECFNSAPLKNDRGVRNFYKKYPKQRLMENAEFDRLYPFVRNDEIKFRSLFTIFAQEEMVRNTKEFNLKGLEITKEKGPFFEISMDNDLSGCKLNFSGYTYLHHDIDHIKNDFVETINRSLECLYQFLSPILSCSLLQHERYLQPTKRFPWYYSNEAQLENFFNTNLDIEKYLYPNTSELSYNGITKFRQLDVDKNYTVNKMTTYSYSSESKIEYVSVFAYGRHVKVPVRYDEFYPEQQSHLTLSWKNKDYNDFICYDIPKQLKQFKIHTIIQDGNQSLVIFDPSVSKISGKESAIISAIKQQYK
ncbi:MAG: hypothetical protein HUJ52_01585 [Malacoplasma sp.]|nr:hypothetical protein [Malacoplasma sp.]